MVVYRLNKNVIFVFMITRYDEFDTNPYKIDKFRAICNKTLYFDVIVCIVNVNDSIMYLTELLVVVIKPLVTYFHLFI